MKDQLEKWIEEKKVIAKNNCESFFQGIPELWFEHPVWCCENGHLHRGYLKSETLGSVCLKCSKPARLFPKNAKIEEYEKLFQHNI